MKAIQMKSYYRFMPLCLVLNLFFCFCLRAQYESLQSLSSDAMIAQKLQLRDSIQHHLDELSSPLIKWQQSNYYHKLAKAQGDSIFIAHSLSQLALMSAILSDTFKYNFQGSVIRSRSIIENLYLPENINHIYRYTQAYPNEYLKAYTSMQSKIGINLQEIPQKGTLDLYPALCIFKDEEGNKTFTEVSKNNAWFDINRTIEQYDTSAVYWVKLRLNGNEQSPDSCIFFVEQSEGFHSWNQIQAYLVHEDGTVDQQLSGISVPKSEKHFRRYNNLITVHLATNEEATLYLRLSATSGRRHPTYISLKATRQNALPNVDTYQANGQFKFASSFTPFQGAKMDIQNIFVDSSNGLSVDQTIAEWNQLNHQYAYDVAVKPAEVYWAKIRVLGSNLFTGKHLFHISPYPFVGTDVFAFDCYDAYVVKDGLIQAHQQTGGTVPVSKRAYRFWANFIAVDVMPNDTIEVFIRMSGGHESYDLSRFDFWHIDPETIFPVQLNNATYNYFYFGALGLQCLFFLLLYFIERERTHLYFALLILGVFLGTAFVDDNYRNFVLFPGLRPFHIPLFFTGIYIVQIGFIKFSETYFDYAKSSIWSRYIIPVFLVISALITINAIWKFDYLVPAYYPVTEGYHISAIFTLMIGIGLSFLLGLLDKGPNRVLKYFFIIAFLPGLFMIMILIARSILGGFPSTYHLIELIPDLLTSYHALRFAILAMLLLLALSMGYRTNLLKAARQQALQENVKAQQIHIKQLEQTNQLQELVRLKTRFYNNITHEFRTPLTVILGMTEQQGHPQAMSLIRRNGKKLLQLINRLLDLSKLDSGFVKANYQLIEIVSYTQYIGESFQSLAEQKYLRLTIYSEIKQLWMDMDEERYRQIISNLLTNAIKFTPESGKIILHLSRSEEELLIKIKDNGIGIKEEALSRIFDRFYQVDNEQSQEEEGTGIGLSLTKELVTLLKGNITVKSQLNAGTTFMIQFPIQQTSTKKLERYEPFTSTIPVSTLAGPGGEKLLGFPKLLLIEDNVDVVIYIQSLLHQFYDLTIAANGEEGIKQALEDIPDIIISDVMMPKKNGFEVLQTLKQDERTSHIPIIMLTAKATQENRLQGLQYGADAYLMKPFDKKELFVRLEKLVKLRQMLHTRYSKAVQPVLTYVLPPENQASAQQPSIDDLFLQKIRKIIDDKLGDTDLDIPYLCKVTGLSTTQLFRKMKALTGEAPISFIRKVRLHKAKSLLETTELNIAEIAYDLGFSDPNYFSRAFRKEFGCSPRDIRT